MPAIAIPALVGALCGFWFPLLDGASGWPYLLLLGGPAIWWLMGYRLLVASVALAVCSLHGHWYLAHLLPAGQVGKDVVIAGWIDGLPVVNDQKASFRLNLARDSRQTPGPESILLRWYEPTEIPAAGEFWRFRARIKEPRGWANSELFDFETWAFAEGIHGSGYVRKSLINARLQSSDRLQPVLRVRESLLRKMEQQLLETPMLPLIAGISLGFRTSVSAATWEVLRDTGTSHLMAISGLHVGMVAIAFWWCCRLLGQLLVAGGCSINPRALASISALLGAWSYILLAGLSVPTLRAGAMLTVALALTGGHRLSQPARVLEIAFLAIIAANPLALLQAGFWLSFAAVCLLFLLGSQLQQTRGEQADSTIDTLRKSGIRRVRAALSMQLWLSIGLALPTLIIFSQVSLAAPLANLVAIPVFMFWVLPMVMLGLLSLAVWEPLAGLPLQLAATGLEYLLSYFTVLASSEWAVWHPGSRHLGQMTLLAVALGVFLLPPPLPGRALAAFMLLVVMFVPQLGNGRALRVDILDVGHGLAVLVRTRSHNLLYDTGPGWLDGDAGRLTVLPELSARGVSRLDKLVVSHSDNDHSGGFASIISFFGPVDSLVSHPLPHARVTQPICRAGLSWRWDGVLFEVLHPRQQHSWSDNDGSCVLRVTAGESVLVLPGDIEAGAEYSIVRQYELESVDLILGAHHGSKTSSTPFFVEATKANFVVFSSGYANRWGFPDSEVVNRWAKNNTCVLSTAISGGLEFVSDRRHGFILRSVSRRSLLRPWVLRDSFAGRCHGTINTADGTV